MVLSLWLPIILSGVALFFASFLSWMVVKLHEKDWRKMEHEDKVMDAVREAGVPEGNYMFPGANTMSEMNEPEYVAKYNAGPRGIVTVLPPANMGKNLALTMLFFFVCNATFAYLKTLPVDFVKIDGLFVRDLAENDNDYAMVKSINEISHLMGKLTIAKFADTQQTVDRLKELGVDFSQGEVFGGRESLH